MVLAPSPPPPSANGLAVCVLASGSKGNAVYISDGTTALLLDAGLSGIEIERRMKSRGLTPAHLTAILVSHEHSDHIKGVGVLSRRYHLPVYMTPRTRRAAESQLGRVDDFHDFECGRAFSIDRLRVHPFSISHDAADPSGFTVSQNGCKIGVATDLGIATAMVREHLKHCRMVLIEANHDTQMLLTGPYPWHLKQRVKSRTGHLSNTAAKELLAEIRHDRLQHVILGHLSEQNNTPQKVLTEIGPAMGPCRAEILVADQNVPTPLFQMTDVE